MAITVWDTGKFMNGYKYWNEGGRVLMISVLGGLLAVTCVEVKEKIISVSGTTEEPNLMTLKLK
jgi:hypothetical protein